MSALADDPSVTTHRLTTCVHCGLPSPKAPEGELSFCCAGCQGAYALIHSWGLDEYYAMRGQLGTNKQGERADEQNDFQELDDAANFGDRPPIALQDGLVTCRLAVQGLHCAACSWLIEKASSQRPGLLSARVRMNDQSVDVVYDPTIVKLSEVGRFLAKLGYRLSPMVAATKQERYDRESRQQLTRIAVAGFCAANAMWIAVALYAGYFSGMLEEHHRVLHFAGVLLSVISVAFPGRVFFQGAIASLRTRTPHMDLPIAIGLGVGAIAGVVVAITGHGEAYFDSVAMLVFLLLVGRWIQFRQQRKAIDSIAMLMRLTPRYANRITDQGTTQKVSADLLEANDHIRVLPGETFPADGVIVAGQTEVDRSLVTGESIPVPRTVGDEIEAGSCNVASKVDICVTAGGNQTRIGKLASLIEEAAVRRAPIVQLADAIGGRFVIGLLLIATITFSVWSFINLRTAISSTVALLIVACPCALALATPLAVSIAVGRGAKRGILIRGGDSLERVDEPGVIWFDKTGTLTQGRMVVREWHGRDDMMTYAAALERGSEHAIARAILNYADLHQLETLSATKIKRVAGAGVEGQVGDHFVQIGNLDYMQCSAVATNQELRNLYLQFASDGATPIIVAVDGLAIGVVALGDVLRIEAHLLVSKLQSAGWKVGILSGDHTETVGRVAADLRIDPQLAIGGASPERKLQIIEESKLKGKPVLMVGDGVNDAAALAAADIGIAIRGGAAASLDAAPVYLSSGRLESVSDFLDASKRTRQTIRRNFKISLSYNAIAVTLAATGWINPLIAAILMPISSLTVLSVILARKTFS